MDECCNSCKYCMRMKRYDYSHGGCEHSEMDGFACLVFEDEGIVIQMIGVDKNIGLCEGYSPRRL